MSPFARKCLGHLCRLPYYLFLVLLFAMLGACMVGFGLAIAHMHETLSTGMFWAYIAMGGGGIVAFLLVVCGIGWLVNKGDELLGR